MPLCLHVLFRVADPLHSNWGDEGTVTWGMFPGGVRGYRRAQAITVQGVGGGMWICWLQTEEEEEEEMWREAQACDNAMMSNVATVVE